MVRPLVRADGISKSYGPTHVLADTTFQITPGDKVALVGPNGAGKTTIFKLLSGQLVPDLGGFERAPDLRVAYLPQVPEAPAGMQVSDILAAPTERAVALEKEIAAIEAWMAEPSAWESPDYNERMTHYAGLQTKLAEERAKGTVTWTPLMGILGLREDLLDARWGELSGGERSKVVLCKVLNQARETDLLLLDEPTNHMDIPTVEFIEDYLMSLDGAVVVAAHDRYLLDNVATRVFELDQRRVFSYTGNYSSYVAQKEAIQRALQARKRREVEEYKRQLQIIEELKRRNKYDAQVQSRQKRVSRQYADMGQGGGSGPSSRGFNLLFETGRVPRRAFEFVDVSKAYGDNVLFEDVSFEVQGGDKLGIIGPNGCGKSTLIKLLVGEERPDAGEVNVGQAVTVGYFHQHHETLEGHRTLYDEIALLRDPPPPEAWTRGLLGRFRFSGDVVHKKVSELSGGERARLALAKFVADQHNLLVLDEPTNHLDIEGQAIVAEALADYEGTVIIVSHDRAFLDQICNRIAVIHGKRVQVFPGNFSEARTSNAMARFTSAGVKARYKVMAAFHDTARDVKYQKGQTLEVTGLETQEVTRLIRRAEADGMIVRDA